MAKPRKAEAIGARKFFSLHALQLSAIAVARRGPKLCQRCGILFDSFFSFKA